MEYRGIVATSMQICTCKQKRRYNHVTAYQPTKTVDLRSRDIEQLSSSVIMTLRKTNFTLAENLKSKPIDKSCFDVKSHGGKLVEVLSRLLSVREIRGSIPRPVKLDTLSSTIRHRCNVLQSRAPS